MYEFKNKDHLEKLYPILKTEADAIVNFTSCDGTMGYKLSSVLGSIYPNIKYTYQNFCAKNCIKKGVIFLSSKSKPNILNIPFKECYRDKIDEDYILSGFKKVRTEYLNKKLKIKSIAIQKGIISDELVDLVKNDLEEIGLVVCVYEKYDYLKELEDIYKEEKKLKNEKIKIEKELKKENLKTKLVKIEEKK